MAESPTFLLSRLPHQCQAVDPSFITASRRKKAANRAKSSKYYDINKTEINEAKRISRTRRSVFPTVGRAERILSRKQKPQEPPLKAAVATSTVAEQRESNRIIAATPLKGIISGTTASSSCTPPSPGTTSAPASKAPATALPPSAAPPRSKMAVLADRIPMMWEQFGEVVSNRPLKEYLTNICERFAQLQEEDLESTRTLFEDEQEKLYQVRELILRYQSKALNLEGCTRVWREWDTLRARVDLYLRELSELECEAILGPGQLVVEFRRKTLAFQRAS
ncbi:hypothetical protein DFP72DRAFT_1076138 [Ephemerocybe angulata]|uniref:Uncharacterized protein n=1 Tax=Ephemerocybe angulata TaxID=980116 RepID=A0A8H6HI53_9AGAR|nr:hypothetical protein DFP72DRAFT_1076138 [Tulosesus angulatus]